MNFLPKFIKAYPSRFQYELKLLKIALHNYLGKHATRKSEKRTVVIRWYTNLLFNEIC